MALKNLYLDFETYYNSKDGYSLRKMPTHDYVRDPRFHPIGVSFGVDDGEVVWFAGDAVAPALASIPWHKVRLVAHNSLFDATILSWVYGYKPAAISCTMSMARASGFAVAAGGASLDALANHARAKGYAMPLKGLEVLKADGKAIGDFSPIELAQYGEYCKDDTRIARALDQLMRPALSPAELYWHDTVIRMYTEPALLLDAALLKEELERVIKKRAELLARVSEEHGTAIMSNPKFAAILTGYGVEPPMKISKTTKKPTFAFAKTDEGLTDLLSHEDPRVRAVVEVRLGAKSSIEQTRTETFLALSAAGLMPMGYNISGAHTGRLSGAHGKCVAKDTRILCYTPDNRIVEKQIVDVLLDDLVWDGEEFVAHDGVIFNGYAEVITYDGITATPDHVVFCGEAPYTPRTLADAASRGEAVVAPDLPRSWQVASD
jgi:hypothetical protein